MSPRRLLISLFLVSLMATALASNPDTGARITSDPQSILVGGDALARAERDTIYLLGGPGRWDGRFETPDGDPDWHGWTPIDFTAPGEPNWHVADHNVPAGGGSLAMWCGETFDNACGDGYGDDYAENLVFSHAVADPAENTHVNLQLRFNSDSEPGYDYFHVQALQGGDWMDLVTPYDDDHDNVDLNLGITFTPGDLDEDGKFHLRLCGTSDSAWSDEDCRWDTEGLAQVDNIQVTVAGVVVSFEDFEDGVSDRWTPTSLPGVGSFAGLWHDLFELDPCHDNHSWQVAFIDDGVVVPGTGGSPCITWCYGPGGYVVNTTGGVTGPDSHLDCGVVSPPLAWPEGMNGAMYSFDVYRHQPLEGTIFYNWHVRSTASADPAALATAPWQDREFMYYGGPGFVRHAEPVADLLEPDRRWVQVALRVTELGWVWGWDGNDATPAPYFDNAAVKAWDYEGPIILTRDIDQAQDVFPQQGFLDRANLASNSCRFDMARNISPDHHLRNDPGDSVIVDVDSPEPGAVLARPPRLYYCLMAQPLFDAVRIVAPGPDGLVRGHVEGAPTIFDTRWSFDLPDTGFFFPGDVIHYYIEAVEDLAGTLRTSLWPADTTGFENFASSLAQAPVYDEFATVRALPSVTNLGGHQPGMLLWLDDGQPDWNVWWSALADGSAKVYGTHYDVYRTRGASSGVGNGLGGRATVATLAGYGALLYTCGSLDSGTLANGDPEGDPSADLQLIMGWIDETGGNGYFAGDNLAQDLSDCGPLGAQFLANYAGISFVDDDVASLIGDYVGLHVSAEGSYIFQGFTEWSLARACDGWPGYDAVVAGEGSREARFLLNGQPGPWDYSAATYRWKPLPACGVITTPYDLRALVPAEDSPLSPAEVRAEFLGEIVAALGQGHVFPGVPAAAELRVSAAPNPFNPSTTVKLALPAASRVRLGIYDLRGSLVRELVDEDRPAGAHEFTWDGRNQHGQDAASGVYFWHLKAGGEERTGKLAMVK